MVIVYRFITRNRFHNIELLNLRWYDDRDARYIRKCGIEVFLGSQAVML